MCIVMDTKTNVQVLQRVRFDVPEMIPAAVKLQTFQGRGFKREQLRETAAQGHIMKIQIPEGAQA